MHRISALATVTLVAVFACSGDTDRIAGIEAGRTRILLTDAPFPYADVARVDLYVTRVAVLSTADSGATDETVAEPRRRFNLLELQDGITTVMGESDIHFGAIAAIRLVINVDSSSVVYTNGDTASVAWGPPGERAIYAPVHQPLVQWASSSGDIIIDVDAGLSFAPGIYWFGQPAPDFVFVPSLRAVNAQAAAAISGTVRGPRGDLEVLEPIPHAVVTASAVSGDPLVDMLPWPIASARADAHGAFTIRHLNPGTYIVRAESPAGGVPMSGSAAQVVTLLMGDEGTVDVNVQPGGGGNPPAMYVSGPSVIQRDATVPFSATVWVDSDTVAATSATWTSRNPSVASIAGNGATVQVTGVAVGSAWLVADWEELTDSALVSVVVGSDSTGGTGGGGPVATVVLNPSGATVAVNDSLAFWADLRDANGVSVARAVTWTVSNPSVLQVMGSFGQTLILRALATGSAVVTATSEGKSGAATVTVQ